MLLAAKTLKANSSQVCTTLSRGAVWIKVTGAAVVEVNVAFEFTSFSLTVAEPVSLVVVLRGESITFLVTAAETVSENVAFIVEFIISPVTLLWI